MCIRDRYYDEYDPLVYKRQYLFLESLVHTDINQNGRSCECEVKIDERYLNYQYPGSSDSEFENIPATGYDVVKWANRENTGWGHGNHGYTVNAGRDDGFWNIAMQDLGDTPGLIRLFKENLIKAGLPIK